MDRRTFLGGLGGTVGMVTLAGCTNILEDSVDASNGQRWLPSPEAISFTDLAPAEIADTQQYDINQYDAVLTSPVSVSNHREVLGTNWERYRSAWADTEYAFPTASELNVVVSAFSEAGTLFRVASGSFSSRRIGARLTDADFETASGGNAEYTYYLREDQQKGYAVTDETLVMARIPSSLLNTPAAVAEPDPGEFDLVGLLDTIIETERGITDRYGDSVSELIPLAEQGLSGDSILYEFHPDRFRGASVADLTPEAGEFPDHVATGLSQQLSGETTEKTLVLVFRNEQVFIEQPVESNIETYVDASPAFRNWREINWQREEETVIIEGVVRSVDAWPLGRETAVSDQPSDTNTESPNANS
jgi:hypothetical protein